MNANSNGADAYWRYLITPEKRATPQLEQLCLGLAKVIVRLLQATHELLLTPIYSLPPNRVLILTYHLDGLLPSTALSAAITTRSFSMAPTQAYP